MAVYTSSPKYAATLLGDEVAKHLIPVTAVEAGLDRVVLATLGGDRELHTAPSADLPWPHLLISDFSPSSQYDQLIEMARSEPRPLDRVACIAGSGLDFHGFKGRPWTAMAGNIHLAVHLAPGLPIERFQIAFTILAAVSVVDALDEVPGLRNRSKIKWVNDILVEGAKVAGILAYTQTRATTVASAVLGIGLNVETTPSVDPTPFVPAAASLRDFLPEREDDVQGPVPFARRIPTTT
jgi:BirA family biotin operon repressor/biotin-[acetyl-CoA-carboxylase] ligase